jgi:sporulation integral membrane protein YlbJ
MSRTTFLSSQKGFKLWVNNVVPSLLPFFICIELIKQTNFMSVIGKLLEPIMRPLFGVPGCGAFALAMGISSGYPVGAKITTDLRNANLCTKTEAERLLSFSNTSGPLFIVGAIGIGMFSDSRVGLLLILTHFIAAITVGLIFKYYKNDSNTKTDKIITQNKVNTNKNLDFNANKLGYIMGEAIKKSIDTLLLICGYIVFFSVLISILSQTGISSAFAEIVEKFLKIFRFDPAQSKYIVEGMLEITNGINSISILNKTPYLERLTIISFILGFGGFSVHMQVSSIISNSDISIKPYLFGKLLQGIFASVYTYLLMKYTAFFNWDVVQTFSYSFSGLKTVEATNLLLLSLTTIVLIGIFLKLFRKKLIL